MATIGVFAPGYGTAAETIGAGPGRPAARNTASIQQALNAGGLVTLDTPGRYEINASLLIGSNTTLRLGEGVELYLANGTSAPVLKTTTMNVTPTPVTLSWSAGQTLTVTWPSHGLTTDDYFCIQGVSTAQPQYNQVYKVVSVTDANTVVVYLPIIPIAAPTGSPTAIKCVQNFRIEGGTYHGNYTNNSGSGFNRVSILIGFAANFKIDKVNGLDNYRLITLGGVMDYSITNIHAMCFTGGSELFKTYGPARNGYACNVSGQAHDDFASIQPMEDSAFLTNRFSGGNIIQLLHENFNGQITAGQAIIPIYGDDAYSATGVVLRNIHGNTVNAQNIITIGKGQSVVAGVLGVIKIDGVRGATTGIAINLAGATTVQRLHIRDVDVLCTAAISTIGTFACRDLLIEDIEHRPAAAGSQCITFNSSTAGALPKVRIARVRSSNAGMTASTPVISVSSSLTAIQNMVIDGVVTESANMRTLSLAVGTMRMLVVRNCLHSSTGDAFIAINGATALTLIAERNDSAALTAFSFASGSAAITCELIARDNKFTGGANGYIRANQVTNALAVSYSGGGNTIGTPAATWTVVAGAPTLNVRDDDLVIDVGLTGIQTQIGQYARHSSAVVGRNGATQQGLCVHNGTNWVALGTGAAQVNVLIV
jgi:hypothetical protein